MREANDLRINPAGDASGWRQFPREREAWAGHDVRPQPPVMQQWETEDSSDKISKLCQHAREFGRGETAVSGELAFVFSF